MHKIETKQILISVLVPILIITLLVITNSIAKLKYQPQQSFLYVLSSHNDRGSGITEIYSNDYTKDLPPNAIVGSGTYYVEDQKLTQECEFAYSNYSNQYNNNLTRPKKPDSCPIKGEESLYVYNPKDKTSQPINYEQAKKLVLDSSSNSRESQIEMDYIHMNNYKIGLCNNDICKNIELPKTNQTDYRVEFLGWIEG